MEVEWSKLRSKVTLNVNTHKTSAQKNGKKVNSTNPIRNGKAFNMHCIFKCVFGETNENQEKSPSIIICTTSTCETEIKWESVCVGRLQLCTKKTLLRIHPFSPAIYLRVYEYAYMMFNILLYTEYRVAKLKAKHMNMHENAVLCSSSGFVTFHFLAHKASHTHEKRGKKCCCSAACKIGSQSDFHISIKPPQQQRCLMVATTTQQRRWKPI